MLLFVGSIWFGFVTVVSVMVVGYEVRLTPYQNFNETIPSWTWHLPRIPEMKKCKASNIKVDEGRLSKLSNLTSEGLL